ncbi:MAG: NFACT family protein [Armatimonadota bacterium]|nr:NFACT family protein [Armatimonadota bacterium]
MSPAAPGLTPPASFDSIILSAVLAECQGLVGARIQRVYQAGPHDVAVALRSQGRGRTLLLSADPRWPRLHLEGEAPVEEATAFVQLLRSRLEGGVVRALGAPAFERLAMLAVDALDGPYDLAVELMGRHANLILCARGVIVGALKPVGLDRARGREVLPGRPYLPPARPRTDPTTVAAEDLLAPPRRPGAEPGTVPRPAWKAVLEATGGIGPALAWEACLRAGADPTEALDCSTAGRAVDALRTIGRAVLAGEFSPVLYRDGAGDPVAYAAFPLRCYPGLQAEAVSMSDAVSAVTGRAVADARSASLRESLLTTVAAATRRVERALEAVARDIGHAEAADRLREQGELILAYLHRVAPGETALEVPGFDGMPIQIALDPGLSGVENAQAYFRRYARAAAARRKLPQRRAALEAERAFLETMATAIAQAEDPDDLWEIEQDLAAAGLRRLPRRSPVRPRATAAGRRFLLPGGYLAQVGRSARENERLTFDVAGPDDWWLHARGLPGAHVVVTGGRSQPPPSVLAGAAAIAAYYSAGRGAGKIPVDITRRRFVRRIRGGRPGQVTYTHERTLVVRPGLPAPATPPPT